MKSLVVALGIVVTLVAGSGNTASAEGVLPPLPPLPLIDCSKGTDSVRLECLEDALKVLRYWVIIKNAVQEENTVSDGDEVMLKNAKNKGCLRLQNPTEVFGAEGHGSVTIKNGDGGVARGDCLKDTPTDPTWKWRVIKKADPIR